MVDNIKNKEKTPGVSCWLDLNYKDKQSDKDVGAVVKHVALVNHPYIEGLGGYEAVSLSEDKEAEKFVPLVMSESKSMKDGKIMKLNDVLKVLKEEHKIDVPKLQGDLKILNKQIEDGDLVKKAEVPATLSEELLTEIKEKLEIDEKVTKVDEIVKALFAKVKETLKLSESKDKKETALEKEVKALRKENDESKAKLTEMEADKAIDALVVENKVLPAEKETLKKLYTKDQALFTEFVATRSKPLIELAEIGAKGDEIPKEEKEKDEAEATRLAKLAEKKGMVKVQT
jgi:phage I-like protein